MSESIDASVPVEPKKKSTLFEVFSRHTDAAIGPYRSVLKSEIEDIQISDLAEAAKAKLDKQLAELDTLQELMHEVAEGKPFKPVVQMHKRLDSENNPRETFTLRFARAGEKMPVGPTNPQNQLGIHVNIAAGGEQALEALYAIGRSGREPQRVLEEFFRQSVDQTVTINTAGVFLDEETDRYRINPQAGITFRHAKGESGARVGGVAYVGNQPHFAELVQRIPLEDFALLQNGVAQLVGRSPIVKQ